MTILLGYVLHFNHFHKKKDKSRKKRNKTKKKTVCVSNLK